MSLRKREVRRRRGMNMDGEGEGEDAGPIKESMVGVAQKKRAAQRKGRGVGDTGLVSDITQAEEMVEEPSKEDEKEHGIELEAFNLKVCVVFDAKNKTLMTSVDRVHHMMMMMILLSVCRRNDNEDTLIKMVIMLNEQVPRKMRMKKLMLG